jgi:hypothetical protein
VLQQIKKHISIKKIWAIIGLMGLITLSLSSPLSAQSVTQGYSSDKTLQRGTVVSLDGENTNKVVTADKQNQDRLHGVVVASNDSSFTLSNESEETFVATVGRFDVLVSTEGGTIQPGDFLTISSIAGIATKAGELDPYTVGKAIVGFDGSENAISSQELKDSLGNNNNVSIGRILVDIGVGSNPLLRPVESTLPEFLEKAAEQIANKPVSPVRVYISIIILLAASGVAGSLLYSGTRSSMVSIGRNPLAKKSVSKSLIQIILFSIIIFLIGLFGVYLLLRL